ncbi:unnamed protein product [Aphanomyces euteiches]|uniref:Uncharacterized protein n=1 Tax=Aphanomyces euteiches TaxID=100861 RepID=A0A6G0XF84_9STRA|nr:hypothetical protein Ae201684_005302 [Aphanomyces euteiches]KAH9053572.1 hypothetical protein Ae201684P_015336 [Aphanomyces euteiches]
MTRVHVWRKGSDEQVLLEKLFKDGSIDPTDTPKSVFEQHEEFQLFGLTVFRAHFNKTRARLGIPCRQLKRGNEHSEDLLELKPTKRLRYQEVADEPEDTPSDVINCIHYACNVATYRDPNSMQEMVIATICLPSGSNKLDFVVDQSGLFGLVKMDWPIIMSNVEDIFANEIKSKTITHYHPKVMALKEQLQRVASVINEVRFEWSFLYKSSLLWTK